MELHDRETSLHCLAILQIVVLQHALVFVTVIQVDSDIEPHIDGLVRLTGSHEDLERGPQIPTGPQTVRIHSRKSRQGRVSSLRGSQTRYIPTPVCAT